MSTRIYKLTEHHRATRDGNFGEVNTTTTEAVSEVSGGLLVTSRVTGTVEGERVDQTSEKFHPGVSIEKAHAYRIKNGYRLIGESASESLSDRGARERTERKRARYGKIRPGGRNDI